MLFPTAIHGQGRTLNIVYTGGVNGELEPCGCSPKTDFGGVARRAGYLAEHEKTLSPYILIDAGNFLDKDTPQGRLKAEAMLKAFSIMKYDAVAVSKNEKEFPYDFLSVIFKKYKLPVISDMTKYRQTVSIRRDGIEVTLSANPKNFQEGKLNILLSVSTTSDIKEMGKWDVIILSSGEILEEPLKANPVRKPNSNGVNGTIIVSGYPKGERLGILTLQIDSGGEVLEFKHRWQNLGKDIKEDINVRKDLKEYDVRVARLLKDDSKPLAEISYLGVSKCIECHQPFVESWKKTKHAGAFPTLERVGKSNDPECIKCHTVGFGEKEGFYSAKTTPMLTNVQCEACHGHGREHLLDFSKPMQPMAEHVCLKCHTKSTSPDFNYPVYLENIKHK